MRILLFPMLLLWLMPVSVMSQQEAHWVHNMFNQVAVNPGYAGSMNAICATGLARQQWAGFKDEDGNNVAPETYQLSINSPVNFLHGGLGATILQDKVGFSKELAVKLMYAYRLDMGMGNLGFGLQVGFLNGYIDYSKFKPRETGDLVIENKQGEQSDMLLDFGFGLHYFVPNKFSIGLSSTRLTESESPGDILAYKTKRHYYLNADYDYAWPGNPAILITPSVLVKSDGVKTQFDIAGTLKYNNKVWGGVSYSTVRVLDPLAVLIGLSIKDIRIGYSYGIPVSSIGSGGSHEIMVGYCFKIEFDSGRRSYKNTRYL
ncbi:MAG: type IX secretion system membrane protein PorP/SprF [Bacteroidales bacterium]|nr:type IX secretion system membrane protein PorP/SprF [Bacteroidales bacterium]